LGRSAPLHRSGLRQRRPGSAKHAAGGGEAQYGIAVGRSGVGKAGHEDMIAVFDLQYGVARLVMDFKTRSRQRRDHDLRMGARGEARGQHQRDIVRERLARAACESIRHKFPSFPVHM
jgi:hypothetical protein